MLIRESIGRRFTAGRVLGAVGILACGAALHGAIASDIPVAGAVARVRNTDGVARRSTQFKLVDSAIDLSGVDPTLSGATVEIFSQTGPLFTLSLPAENWEASGVQRRFRFRSRSNARLRSRLVGGRLIQLLARGPRSYEIAGPQERMVMRMTIGSTRFCAEFGGTIAVDEGGRFTALRAPAPIACPLAPGEETTTTTTAPTTTVTTTTDVSTTTTSETTTTETTTTETTVTETSTTETTVTDTSTTETTVESTTSTTAPFCGNQACDGEETPDSCYADCGSCGDGQCTVEFEDADGCYDDCGSCGDAVCSGPEDADNCYDDCGFCGDAICTTSREDESSCYTDCGFCGDGFCTGPEENGFNCAEDCFSGS